MKVTLIAKTVLAAEGVQEDGAFSVDPVIGRWMDTELETLSPDALSEFAGRSCYQSFHKPNPKTAANSDYIAAILAKQHESTLEHASATFYIEGVSRALTHELIRHRHLSFSELSQRFVNVEEAEFVVPPALRERGYRPAGRDEEFREWYGDLMDYLKDKGYTRKQSREAARAVMPNATETRIVVTGNHRAWRDVLKKRYSTHADAEIRELATELLRQLREIAPAIYQDFPVQPFGTEE